jgi:hypothetical protein
VHTRCKGLFGLLPMVTLPKFGVDREQKAAFGLKPSSTSHTKISVAASDFTPASWRNRGGQIPHQNIGDLAWRPWAWTKQPLCPLQIKLERPPPNQVDWSIAAGGGRGTSRSRKLCHHLAGSPCEEANTVDWPFRGFVPWIYRSSIISDQAPESKGTSVNTWFNY